jgi:hypothetical protein
MTGVASDPPAWQPHIGKRPKARRELVAKRAKDAADPLKLVIVRDMWLVPHLGGPGRRCGDELEPAVLMLVQFDQFIGRWRLWRSPMRWSLMDDNPTNRKSTMVATNDIGAEVATLLTGPAWSGQRIVELGSMVSADEVAEQLGEVLNLDVKALAVPRAAWAEAFEQFGIQKGHTGPAEEMFEAVNAGWMDLGVEGTEHVAGTTSARDVFAAAQKAVTA